MRVYLAGPITGQTYDGATTWRDEFAAFLAAYGHSSLSPMRGKFYLKGEAAIGDVYEDFPMSSGKGIFGRDSFDCRNTDVLLVNLTGADRVSIGSVMEIQMGRDFNKYVLVVMEPENIHNHVFIREAASLVVATLDVAKTVIQMLGQGYAVE